MAWKKVDADFTAKLLDMNERGEKREVMALELGLKMSGLYYHIRRLNIQRPIARSGRLEMRY